MVSKTRKTVRKAKQSKVRDLPTRALSASHAKVIKGGGDLETITIVHEGGVRQK